MHLFQEEIVWSILCELHVLETVLITKGVMSTLRRYLLSLPILLATDKSPLIKASHHELTVVQHFNIQRDSLGS